MHKLQQYHINTELHRSEHSVVYRGQREADGLPVVIKFLDTRQSLTYNNAKLRQEYTLSRQLNSPSIVQAYELEPYNDSFALVMEDFGGIALSELIHVEPMAFVPFLRIAIQIVEALGVIHANGIIHKDIKPSNIIINPDTLHVKVSDFGIASLLSRETQSVGNPSLLEGTLAYMSPEQTGRMNRPIDYRSDFYSFGVLCYELITGMVPFQSADSLELVHQHIALVPPPLRDYRRDVPPMIEQIVLKLLAKPAEERYQSAYGLRKDLEECLHQLETNGSIAAFALGRFDVSEKFQLPPKLYGREAEILVLLQAFAAAAHGEATLLTVTGPSGIGKSALVHEIHKPLVEQKGYFISGKFDQLNRDTPLSAVIQAFQEMVRQILTEPASSIAAWKTHLLAALGSNGRLIIDVIPEVELIIGAQPEVVSFGPTEEQYRFRSVLRDFIGVFAQPTHPLVLFLDDIQWADPATIKLIELLFTDITTNHMLLITAYRDAEIEPNHPFLRLLETLRSTHRSINAIAVHPLLPHDMQEFVADTLHAEPTQAAQLAQLIQSRTDGNPFFAGELLKTLFQQQLITFNQATGVWEWEIARIEQSGVTHNVIELMTHKINQLPPETQTALRLAACIGNQFRLQTLAMLMAQSAHATAQALRPALEIGLVVPVGETYRDLKVLETYTDDLAMDTVELRFRFLHDRIQEAAYSLLPLEQKRDVHLRIGRSMRARSDAARLDERLFDVVSHFNFAQALITTDDERHDVLQLNIRAGQKAKKSTAYDAAARYFAAAAALLPANSWQTLPHDTFVLHRELAETAFLQSNYDQTMSYCQELLRYAPTLQDKMAVYELMLGANSSQGNFGTSLDIALTALKQLGIQLPRHPNQGHVVLQLVRTRTNIGLRSTNQLLELPVMSDPIPLMAMRLLVLMAPTAYQSEANLLPIIVFTMVDLSVRYGNTALSSYGYSLYAMAMNGVLGNLKTGLAYSQLAVRVMQRFDAQDLRAKNEGMYNFFLRHWKEPLRVTVQPMLELADLAREVGDIEYQAFNYFFYCQARFGLGDNLEVLEDEFTLYHNAIKQLKQSVQQTVLAILLQTVQNLRGNAADVTHLVGDYFDANAIDTSTIYDSAAFYIHFYHGLLQFLFKQPAAAYATMKRAAKRLPGVMSMNVVPLFHWYYGLIALALYDDAPDRKKPAYLARAVVSQRKLAGWAKYAPANQNHRVALLQAEIARVRGKDRDALKGYARSIALAGEQGYNQDAALANELAAAYFMRLENPAAANNYILAAYELYARWGATAKLHQLEQTYSSLVATPTKRTSRETLPVVTPNSKQVSGLDLGTVIKASQAISSEVQLDRLLTRLMTSVIENAGAERGFLLLPKDKQWIIEATGSINNAAIDNAIGAPIEEQSTLLPSSIIHYVARTNEHVLLNDAANEGVFTHDHSIVVRRPKSVLCIPLLKQGTLNGILYLENNLNTGVFTLESLQVLRLLASQAAISIDNARLYTNLEQVVHVRTAELRTANMHLQQLNDQFTSELAMARTIQQSLLPSPSPQWSELTVVCDTVPALAVGGDFYTYHRLTYNTQRSSYAVAIGDVSGKGMPAALLMGISLASLRSAVDCGLSPGELLAHLDGDLSLYTRTTRQNCALVYVEVEMSPADGNQPHLLHVANAGCVTPLIRRVDGTVQWIEAGGVPLGVGLGAKMGYQEFTVELATGDQVILTSDGVVEANNLDGELFGFERFEQVVKAGPGEAHAMQSYLKTVLTAFVGNRDPHDDLTIVVIQAH